MKISKYIGMKIGQVTILDVLTTVSSGGKNVQSAKVSCSCGSVYTTRVSNLMAGRGKMCRACYLRYIVEEKEKRGGKEGVALRRRAYVLKYRHENKEQLTEKLEVYKTENKDKINESQAAYRAANKDKIREANRVYREKNKDKVRAALREYQKANPHRMRASKARAEAQKVRATPRWADASEIQEIYRGAYLRSCSPTKYHVDHIVPLRHPLVCGLHCEANLQILPDFENIAKSNKYWPDIPQINTIRDKTSLTQHT